VLLKGPPEVQEVIPSGVAGDEGASEIGASVVFGNWVYIY
jgi:hypothetical protein